jgi:hypothetical protein
MSQKLMRGTLYHERYVTYTKPATLELGGGAAGVSSEHIIGIRI